MLYIFRKPYMAIFTYAIQIFLNDRQIVFHQNLQKPHAAHLLTYSEAIFKDSCCMSNILVETLFLNFKTLKFCKRNVTSCTFA